MRMAFGHLSKGAAAALLALGLAGCFGGAKAPPELLTLTAEQAPETGATRTAAAGESVAVVTPITIQYLTSGTFADQPKELFRNLLAETIAARTGRLVLDPNNFSEAESLTVSGQLLQFGLDPTRNEAVVTFEAGLSRGPNSLRTQRFEARVPVTAQTALAVAPALNQAANRVAQGVADWIGR